jgi:hypothetical protein
MHFSGSALQGDLDSNDQPDHDQDQSDTAGGSRYSREAAGHGNDRYDEKRYRTAEHDDDLGLI